MLLVWVVYQVALSTCEKKVAFCKLLPTEVERGPTVLSALIRSSVQVFRYCYVNPTQTEPVLEIPQG